MFLTDERDFYDTPSVIREQAQFSQVRSLLSRAAKGRRVRPGLPNEVSLRKLVLETLDYVSQVSFYQQPARSDAPNALG